MSNKISLTPLELKTIIEDAFIDGWHRAQDADWYEPEFALSEGDSETAIAIKNLMEEQQ